MGQLLDALGLAALDGFCWDQFGADAERGGPGENETCGGLLVHSSGGDQVDGRERGFESANVLPPADRGTGKLFYKTGAAPPGGDDFRGSERAGQDGERFL